MIRVFEAFAGIGAQRTALANIGVPHEVVAISEIDKYAIKSYEAIYGETNNLGDITKIDVNDIPEHDLFTYSFPCQDISLAGKQKGLDKDSSTRSSLLWECERIIRYCRPKYLLLENVKNLVGKKHKANFDEWLKILDELGYYNHWQVLNAKDYGIAQNRERVFVVSIRKDLRQTFQFPKKQELSTCLKDYLETEVDEKFYLNEDLQKSFEYCPEGTNVIDNTLSEGRSFRQNNLVYDVTKHAPTLTARDFKDPKRILVTGEVKGIKFKAHNRVLNPNGMCETICAACGMGGNTQPKILIKNATKQGYLEAENGDGIDLGYPNSKTRRGRVQKGCSQTLTTSDQLGVLDNYRIRKLTPLECWRLMGFSDEAFYKAQAVNSNTQLYKQAGNSICVPVLEAIFQELFKGGNQ